MRILLIMPDANVHRLRFGRWNRSFREAPLTLTTLAALVPGDLKAEIRLVDESVEPLPEELGWNVVGISCLTGTAQRAYRLADRYRAAGCRVVLGGVHATLCPDEAAAHADILVTGFAEETWPRLLRDVAAGQARSHYAGEPPPALAGLPRPRRDLQANGRYMLPQTVFATRGCRGRCEFCTVPAAGFGWATRPVAEVVAEVRDLPGRRFALNDVSLCEDRDYALELCRGLAPLGKEWGGLATARVADDQEMLAALAASGCRFLLVGFESISAESLGELRKRYNRPADYAATIRAFHRHGICVQGCFIFGMDHDTPESIRQTPRLVAEMGVDIPRFALFTPYPGTPVHARLAAENRLLHQHWPHYDTQHVVFQPRHMAPATLDALFREAYAETYRLGAITRRALVSPHPVITYLGNLAYRLYLRRLRNEKDRIFPPDAPRP